MSRLYLDLTPTYVLAALLILPLLRRRPTVLHERWLAILSGLVILTFWLLAMDIMLTQGIRIGTAWIAVVFAIGILLPLPLIAKRMCGWVVLKVDREDAQGSIEKALQGLRFSYDIKLPSFFLSNYSGRIGRITVRCVPVGFLWITFKFKANEAKAVDPKFFLLQKVMRKFLVYGAPKGTRA